MKIKLNYLFAALISFSSFNVIAKNNSPCDEFFSSSEEKAILDFKKQVDEVVISKIIEEYNKRGNPITKEDIQTLNSDIRYNLRNLISSNEFRSIAFLYNVNLKSGVNPINVTYITNYFDIMFVNRDILSNINKEPTSNKISSLDIQCRSYFTVFSNYDKLFFDISNVKDSSDFITIDLGIDLSEKLKLNLGGSETDDKNSFRLLNLNIMNINTTDTSSVR